MRLLAPGAQARGQRGDIGGAFVAVQRRHLHDHAGHDGVQARMQRKQVAPLRGETAQVFLFRQIKAAGQAGQQQAEQEDIGDLVMMPQRLFPAAQAGQIRRMGDGRVRLGQHGQIRYLLAAVGTVFALQRADDIQRAAGARLDVMDRGNCHAGRLAIRIAQGEGAIVADLQRAFIQRRYPPAFVQRAHLRKQGQQQQQDVVGAQWLAGLGVDHAAQAAGGGNGVGVRIHALASRSSWRLKRSSSRLPKPASRRRLRCRASKLPSSRASCPARSSAASCWSGSARARSSISALR